MEKVVEIKTCKHCNINFDITDKDLEFYEKVSPSFGGKKYLVPSPTLCSNCRLQKKIVWRNERNLYHRKCYYTEKDILSVFSPDKLFKICEQKAWWNDKCDPSESGRDFDFNKGFFEQFRKLQIDTPKISLLLGKIEKTDYANHGDDLKNCYLVFGSCVDEDCMYGNYVNNSENCIDNLAIRESRLAYECTDCQNGYNIKFCIMSNNCMNSMFLYNSNGCQDCILCSNLNNKKYCYLNKQYSKEEYTEKIKNINLGNYSEFKKIKNEFYTLKLRTINRSTFIESSENVSGDLIVNSKNCELCFDLSNSENCKNIVYGNGVTDSRDLFSAYKTTELCYESAAAGNGSYNCLFCYLPWESQNLLYCVNMVYSKNCFGCTDMRNKQYCILNKQYTKEEYNKLVPKIIEYMQKTGEWGEFFPSSLSPFGYNETVANEYFPLTKKEAIEKGFNRSDYESPLPKVDKIIPANKLPDDIKDIPDDILNRAIECEITKKPFRIISQELEFYRKHNLPIPRRHPDQRHLDRMKLRNPRKLYKRKCDKCSKEIQTTYSPDREEIVYCQTCYESEIY